MGHQLRGWPPGLEGTAPFSPQLGQFGGESGGTKFNKSLKTEACDRKPGCQPLDIAQAPRVTRIPVPPVSRETERQMTTYQGTSGSARNPAESGGKPCSRGSEGLSGPLVTGTVPIDGVAPSTSRQIQLQLDITENKSAPHARQPVQHRVCRAKARRLPWPVTCWARLASARVPAQPRGRSVPAGSQRPRASPSLGLLRAVAAQK